MFTCIGKKQEVGNAVTTDIQMLKTLQNLVKDSRYQALSAEDKRSVQIATLLHNLTKVEGLKDITNPTNSAYDAYYLLEKMGLTEAEKVRIYHLIKNQDMFNNLYSAKDIAFDLRTGNDFEVASLMAMAKLKASGETKENMKLAQTLLQNIKTRVDEIKQTSILLPQTKIPKASKLKPDGKYVKIETTTDAKGNPITNTVIRLEKDIDLGQYGFEEGLISNDLNVLVHALDYENQSAVFQALGQIDSDALLSSSYITYNIGNYHVFRTQGFILDIAGSDIHAGTYKDFGSGCGKSLDILKSQYLFGGKRGEYRTFFSDQLKRLLHLSDKEYANLYREIVDKPITQLDKTHPIVAKVIRELFNSMEIKKRSHGRDYNEMLISRPKIQAVFWQGKVKDMDNVGKSTHKPHYTLDRVPEFLRKYAADNDLPIIYFGE